MADKAWRRTQQRKHQFHRLQHHQSDGQLQHDQRAHNMDNRIDLQVHNGMNIRNQRYPLYHRSNHTDKQYQNHAKDYTYNTDNVTYKANERRENKNYYDRFTENIYRDNIQYENRSQNNKRAYQHDDFMYHPAESLPPPNKQRRLNSQYRHAMPINHITNENVNHLNQSDPSQSHGHEPHTNSHVNPSNENENCSQSNRNVKHHRHVPQTYSRGHGSHTYYSHEHENQSRYAPRTYYPHGHENEDEGGYEPRTDAHANPSANKNENTHGQHAHGQHAHGHPTIVIIKGGTYVSGNNIQSQTIQSGATYIGVQNNQSNKISMVMNKLKAVTDKQLFGTFVSKLNELSNCCDGRDIEDIVYALNAELEYGICRVNKWKTNHGKYESKYRSKRSPSRSPSHSRSRSRSRGRGRWNKTVKTRK